MDARSHTNLTGTDARVNWISCDDIGNVGAALLIRALLSPEAMGGFRVRCRQQMKKRPANDPTLTSHAHHPTTPQAIDVLGPEKNTVSGPEMAAMATRSSFKEEEVRYEAVPVPSDDAYGGLWAFLRAGGFDAFSDAADWLELAGGRPPLRLEDHLMEELGGGGGLPDDGDDS